MFYFAVSNKIEDMKTTMQNSSISLTEQYTWQQTAAKSKLEKLEARLEMMAFAIEGKTDDWYQLSQLAARQGMQLLAQRCEDNWQAQKEMYAEKYPTFDFEKRFRIKIYGEPTGTKISLDEFVGFDYQHQPVDVRDYRGRSLCYALLEPPYSIRKQIDAKFGSEQYEAQKTKLFTELYRMFLSDFILLPKHALESDYVIYTWADDWSNFFDAGKEWWGNYYWTVYNKKNHTIIVLAASETD